MKSQIYFVPVGEGNKKVYVQLEQLKSGEKDVSMVAVVVFILLFVASCSVSYLL